MVAACSDEEKYSTTNTDVLTFSVDTLKMDTVFSTIHLPILFGSITVVTPLFL